jgi:hypothetical protein
MLICYEKYDRSVAQLVERRSPKPEVAGSMPVTPASEYLVSFCKLNVSFIDRCS